MLSGAHVEVARRRGIAPVLDWRAWMLRRTWGEKLGPVWQSPGQKRKKCHGGK